MRRGGYRLDAVVHQVALPVDGRLRLRSQFVLGPRFVEAPEGWTRVGLGRGLFLTVHPDLDVRCVRTEKQWIALLGYILDPFQPAATNADVLADLLRELAAGADLTRYVSRFGGRWILIADDGERVRLLHDALGLRQAFYTDVKQTTEMWCASQPGILADVLNLQLDLKVLAHVRSGEWVSGEYWLPGEASTYVGTKHLLPNHYLDLSSGMSHRYWPLEHLEPLEMEDCVERCSRILEGLMTSASLRFRLAISLTAGRDSRLVLASARRIAQQVSFVTLRKPGQPPYDVEVPSRLLRTLRLQHEIIPWPASVNEDFARLFRGNVSLAHGVWIPEAQAVLEYNGLDKVAVTGSGGEIARPYATRRFHEKAVTPEALRRRVKMGRTELAAESLAAWLATLPSFRNPGVRDLLYWEQRCGNWLAMNQLEFDIAWKDILTPYNCRMLLANMLSVDSRFRTIPSYRLYESLMRRLWPDVLAEHFPEARRPFILNPRRIRRTIGLLRRKLH